MKYSDLQNEVLANRLGALSFIMFYFTHIMWNMRGRMDRMFDSDVL